MSYGVFNIVRSLSTGKEVPVDEIATNESVASTPILATGSTTGRSLSDRFADVVNVKDFGAVGDGSTDDSAAFTQASTTGLAVLVPKGSYRLASSVTITPSIAFFDGASVSVDSGFTLTINNRIDAGLYKIFSGSGFVVFGQKVGTAYPEWFGALDGTGTDGAAIRKCLDACKTNRVTTLFSAKSYTAESGSDLSIYPDTPIHSMAGAVINASNAASGWIFTEGNYVGRRFVLPLTAQFSNFNIKLQNASILNLYCPGINSGANNGLVMEGLGGSLLDNKIEIQSITGIASNAVIYTGDSEDVVIQGNEIYVNFINHCKRALAFFAADGIQPNWDSNKFVCQAIDPAQIAGSCGFANIAISASVARQVIRCETWIGGIPEDGFFVTGRFTGTDFYINYANIPTVFSQFNLLGSGNTVRDGNGGAPASEGRKTASNTPASRGSFNDGVLISTNRIRTRITTNAAVADGGTFTAYIYSIYQVTDQFTVVPVNLAGWMVQGIAKGANTSEIAITIRNISGASLPSGASCDLDVIVGVI